MTNTALILIDIQNDYFENGNFPLDGAEQAAKKAAKVKKYFTENNFPVFIIQHESLDENATFFRPGTVGQELAEQVWPEGGESVVIKHYPNSFKETSLLDDLRKLETDHLVVTGMMTFMCVDATVRAAIDLGFTCTLIHDATAARPLEFGDNSVAAEDVQTSFVAALSFLCDEVLSADDYLSRVN